MALTEVQQLLDRERRGGEAGELLHLPRQPAAAAAAATAGAAAASPRQGSRGAQGDASRLHRCQGSLRVLRGLRGSFGIGRAVAALWRAAAPPPLSRARGGRGSLRPGPAAHDGASPHRRLVTAAGGAPPAPAADLGCSPGGPRGAARGWCPAVGPEGTLVEGISKRGAAMRCAGSFPALNAGGTAVVKSPSFVWRVH